MDYLHVIVKVFIGVNSASRLELNEVLFLYKLSILPSDLLLLINIISTYTKRLITQKTIYPMKFFSVSLICHFSATEDLHLLWYINMQNDLNIPYYFLLLWCSTKRNKVNKLPRFYPGPHSNSGAAQIPFVNPSREPRQERARELEQPGVFSCRYIHTSHCNMK